jgi:dTMP kinase
MDRTRFITLEGGEAVGKTTQITLLEKRLTALGQRVIVTREPGGTPLGESIRHLLKHAPEGRGMGKEAELLLFLASRAELVRKVIVPALDSGAWVLSDRFLDSTTVYQGVGRCLPAEIVDRLNAFAVGPHLPGLTLILDLEPAEARRRRELRTAAAAPDRMEAESDEFYTRVRDGYHALARDHAERAKLVSAAGTIEQIGEALWREIAATYHL